MSASKQVWLITGTNVGFGLELSQLALSHGHTVVATARNPSKYRQALKDAGADLVSIDMTAPESDMKALVDGIVSKHGRIDVLINNAGYIEAGAVEEVSRAASNRQLNVNLFGTLKFIRGVLPHMRRQRSGVIVNLSSLASMIGGMGYGMYSASKFALEGMSDALADEVRPFGICVHVIEPGYFRTNFLGSFGEGRISKIDGYAGMDQILGGLHDKQPGDPKKGMLRLYEVVTGTGMGTGKE